MRTRCKAHDAEVASLLSVARLAPPAEGRVDLNRVHADRAVAESLLWRLRVGKGQRWVIVIGFCNDNLYGGLSTGFVFKGRQIPTRLKRKKVGPRRSWRSNTAACANMNTATT